MACACLLLFVYVSVSRQSSVLEELASLPGEEHPTRKL